MKPITPEMKTLDGINIKYQRKTLVNLMIQQQKLSKIKHKQKRELKNIT